MQQCSLVQATIYRNLYENTGPVLHLFDYRGEQELWVAKQLLQQ